VRRFEKIFLVSVAILLCITGIAKLTSATGHTPILNKPDGIFFISNRNLLISVGVIELIVAGILGFSKSSWLKISVLASLCLCFVLYRAGRFYLGIQDECACLGVISAAVHLSKAQAQSLSTRALIYMLLGTTVLLVSPANEVARAVKTLTEPA
jgi:hypothetical protein